MQGQGGVCLGMKNSTLESDVVAKQGDGWPSREMGGQVGRWVAK
jgi:hypothetical protein